MKIGINALFIRPGWHGGTEVYLRSLLSALLEIGHEHEFYLFTNKENHHTFLFDAPNIKKIHIPIWAGIKPLRVFSEQVALPRQASKLKLDIIHGPGYTTPIFGPCARVVTIHDLQYCYYPEIYPKGQYIFFRLFIPLSAKTSSMIIVDANSTKIDLEKFLAIPPQKIKTIHLAPHPRFTQPPSPNEIRAVRNKYNLPHNYILTISSFRPQKNTLRLIKAYHQLCQKGITCKLVLVGRKLDPYSDVQQLIRDLKLDGKIITTGYVPDEDLPALYKEADLFVYPSYFEGFGIPVLEAMACGLPVILSNVASLPEAGGQAGYYVDPYNIEDIAEAMYNVLTQPALYKELSSKGLKHAHNFSWERVARETLEVYNQVVSNH
jgi:glycosyltransferase involved in cell wall biosynthesis